jgi:glyoxylate utilization-related uncharacterized protein
MTPKLHRVADAVPFSPDGHIGVSPVRLSGTAPEEPVSIVLSTYRPGAQAEMSPVALDTTYLVLTGELTVVVGDERFVLTHLDSLFLPQGCVRSVDNLATEPASMLVIRPTT